MPNNIKFLLFFLCSIFSTQTMEYFQKLVGENRIMDVPSVPVMLGKPNSGEFQVSYKGQGVEVDGEFRLSHDLTSAVPTLGFYSRPHYLYRTRYLLVQFDPLAAWNFLPARVKYILEPLKKMPNFSMRGIIAVHGMLYTDDMLAKKSNLVNILYHAWVGEILNQENNYKIDLPMGIFEADGIERYRPEKFDLEKSYAQKTRGAALLPESWGIAFDKLTKQTVYFHSGYSPDNAVFVISRDLATFWSVAIYANKHALITFHILINDIALENIIGKRIVDANTLKDLLVALYENVLPDIQKQADKNALQNAIIVVRNLIGGSYPPYNNENALLIQKLHNLREALYLVQRLL